MKKPIRLSSFTDNGGFKDKNKKVTTLTDVILVNVSNSNEHLIGQFKWQLYEHFGIESSRYESEWEFEEYIRLAEPAYHALQVLPRGTHREPCVRHLP